MSNGMRDGFLGEVKPVGGSVAEVPPLVRKVAEQLAPHKVFDWKTAAALTVEVNTANGFDVPTWEKLPTKLLLVITELDEAVSATDDARHGDEHNFGEELADAAIRLLHILASVWPGEWHIRNLTIGVVRSVFQEPAAALWPAVSTICQATECWRKEKRADAALWCEYALSTVIGIADAYGVDLQTEVATKLVKNAQRGYLHGKVRTDG